MTTPTTTRVPRIAWVVSTVIVLGAFMTQLDAALVNIGLATVAHDLSASLPTTQWTVSGYLLGLVIGLPLCGWAGKAFGAGRVWLAVLAAFTVLSGLCATSPNVEMLITWRCLQGLAGGLLLPSGQMIIAQVAGRDALGRVMSVVGSALVIAPALGPVLGSWVLANADWPWLFLINLPIGAAGLLLGWRFIPRGGRGSPPAFDGSGFLLIGVGLPLLAYAITEFGHHRSVGTPTCWLPLMGGVAALAGFVLRGRRTASAARLIDLDLFGTPRFRAAAVVSTFVGVVQFGALVSWPLYLQILGRYSLVDSGLIMVGFAAGSALLILSGRLTDRYGGGPVCVIGTVLLVLALIPPALGVSALSLIELSLVVLGAGSAMSVVPASTVAYVSIRPNRIPDAVTIVNILLRVGGALGAALVVAVIGSQSLHGSVDASRFHAAFWVLLLAAVGSLASAVYLVSAPATAPTAIAPPDAAPQPADSAQRATR